MNEDLYFKKRITYSLSRQKFQFDTAELLFSTHEIDLGTQFLLRNVLDRPERSHPLGAIFPLRGHLTFELALPGM